MQVFMELPPRAWQQRDFYKEIHEVQQEKHQVSQRTFPKSWSEKELWGAVGWGLAFSVWEGAPTRSLDPGF